MTRKEFLFEFVAPALLSKAAQDYAINGIHRAILNQIFKDFSLFKAFLFGLLTTMSKDDYTYQVLKDEYKLSEEQVKDYLNSKKIERDYLRILWKHCKKRHTEFKVTNSD